MTFDVVKEALNKLAKAAGFPGLPKSVTEQSFNSTVPAILEGWIGKSQRPDPMAEVAEKTKDAAKQIVAMSASRPTIQDLEATLAKVEQNLAALEARRRAEWWSAPPTANEKVEALRALGINP